ncbi:4-hydroxy-tetrahydrodipicolinate synthase [Luteimonas sp. MC1750]|uniref:4-hydroxy-tetrahydrodipicolinate synthase n=1 Tax=Luteimonas sp. MC1750 TaxID=2799326 RepID=UPI0018F0E3EE|nr:4-hydroxy-tetrahydrodipicolinate synthase [Luteimonas sp. MC1750]MBJ6984098.1 4-hydroxy-tetrahydrodipicolinate synthase [Luteimonas sp. MC1750]QQO06905.1 4-hydroxy-tetrahydrodipicolinate synthase [Luteimonas sp. MC1750]
MHLSGSITALATPFTAAGDLDIDAWLRLVDAQLAGGTQALVVAGSTGEAAALTPREYETLLRAAVGRVAGRVPVAAGTGQSGTAHTIERTRLAAACGADAALVVTPPYVRPTQAGLLAHYRAVADDGALPVILYNVPPRTGCDMQPGTVAALANHDAIIGIKEAVADEARMQALLELAGPGFAILGGDDATAGRAMLAGAEGLVSVASNAAPAAFRRLCDLARGGDVDGCAAHAAAITALVEFCGVESNPIPVKALLARLGFGHVDGIRLPLLPLSAQHAATADRIAGGIAALEQTCRDALAA